VAFVINGLPHFGSNDSSDDLANVLDSNPPGIRPGIPQDILGSGRTSAPAPGETSPNPEDKERFRDLLPGTISASEVANLLRPETPEGGSEIMQSEPARPDWPKVHVVRKGDNLGDIAKMYYGSREGNRKANVLRIFRSNRSVLESPDKIFPGQKLVIPSLWASGTRLKAIEKIFPTSMFERVESIGRTHL
jgi:LysM repeat protein